jgi:hypothetical protein
MIRQTIVFVIFLQIIEEVKERNEEKNQPERNKLILI